MGAPGMPRQQPQPHGSTRGSSPGVRRTRGRGWEALASWQSRSVSAFSMSCAQSLGTERGQGAAGCCGAQGDGGRVQRLLGVCQGVQGGPAAGAPAPGAEGVPCQHAFPAAAVQAAVGEGHLSHRRVGGSIDQALRDGTQRGQGCPQPRSPAVGSAPAQPSPRTGPAPRGLSPQRPPHRPSPGAPERGSCLVLVQQQLENGLAGGEEADLLDDVHPMVHANGLVQPAVICEGKMRGLSGARGS